MLINNFLEQDNIIIADAILKTCDIIRPYMWAKICGMFHTVIKVRAYICVCMYWTFYILSILPPFLSHFEVSVYQNSEIMMLLILYACF